MDIKNYEKIISELDIEEELRQSLYKYLLVFFEHQKYPEYKLIFSQPYQIFDDFLVNRIIDFREHASQVHYWEFKPNPSTFWISGSIGAGKTTSKILSDDSDDLKISESVINHKFENILTRLEKLEKENVELKNQIYNASLWSNTDIGIQYIPVSIYISSDEPIEIFNVYESVIDFLRSIGFEKSIEFQSVKGSWFKRMLGKSKEAITSSEVSDRLKKAEYGIEVNAILKQQSEIDKNQSEALLNILKSVETINNAAIRIGSLLVVKLTNEVGEANVQVRTLTIKELSILNKNPELLHQPNQILIALSKAVENDNKTTEN